MNRAVLHNWPYIISCAYRKHCAKNQKVAVYDSQWGSLIFHWLNPSGCTMALGWTQPLTEMRRLQVKCDGTRWRTGGEVKGKQANGVGSQYPSHYLGTWCIQHYYRWSANFGVSSRLNWPSRRFKWTLSFRRKTKYGFCGCAITRQLASTRFISWGGMVAGE